MQIYGVEKEKTISVLEANRSRISITPDMWTSSHQKKGFMAVTTHFIDDSWAMQNLVKKYESKFKSGDENSIYSNSSLASQLEMPNNSSKRDERLLSYDLFVSSDGPTHVKSGYDAYLEEKVLLRTKDLVEGKCK
ncbi:hypothetical protein EZV62_023922 [Acer yangbiense]|uniref:HAT C-terminal dimerisation domain-containing protein n=1 Tax=Acer yangbiense TaxID=1000413 RepID=A0A5C7H362_9ROSI|nr:hypothetical protein EZV62_023922 [Acer yangbiense]